LAADDVNPFWASRPADRCDHRQQPMAEQLRPDGQGLVRAARDLLRVLDGVAADEPETRDAA